jgi:hypothetical protein
VRTLKVFAFAGVLASAPSVAQDFGPSQIRLWAQIYRSQHPFIGQYTGRVDGRPNRNAGFPPSAADKHSYSFDLNDCTEVDAFAPDVRPGWQMRVRSACP